MKRIAENIAKAVLSTFKPGKESVMGIRYYDSNPRESSAEMPADCKNSINTWRDDSLERAYAAGNEPGKIQYC